MIIGIVSRNFKDGEYNILGTVDTYYNAVTKYGGTPIIIPFSDNLHEVLKFCKGIIMPGGEDITEYDKYICKYAIENDIPILGICLGMQIMATYDNDNDLEKNETELNHMNLTADYVHEINIDKDSFLYKILEKETIDVNSRHNYHAINPGSFEVSAMSDDGLIEAIEMKNKKFAIGVQYHPERMLSYDEYSNKLFQKFMEICKNNVN